MQRIIINERPLWQDIMVNYLQLSVVCKLAGMLIAIIGPSMFTVYNHLLLLDYWYCELGRPWIDPLCWVRSENSARTCNQSATVGLRNSALIHIHDYTECSTRDVRYVFWLNLKFYPVVKFITQRCPCEVLMWRVYCRIRCVISNRLSILQLYDIVCLTTQPWLATALCVTDVCRTRRMHSRWVGVICDTTGNLLCWIKDRRYPDSGSSDVSIDPFCCNFDGCHISSASVWQHQRNETMGMSFEGSHDLTEPIIVDRNVSILPCAPLKIPIFKCSCGIINCYLRRSWIEVHWLNKIWSGGYFHIDYSHCVVMHAYNYQFVCSALGIK